MNQSQVKKLYFLRQRSEKCHHTGNGKRRLLQKNLSCVNLKFFTINWSPAGLQPSINLAVCGEISW